MDKRMMRLIPVTLADANAYVAAHHRHHKPVRGHKFSIGCEAGGKLVGVAIVGRPVSRYLDNGSTLEVTRLCTDSTRNACSFLYGAAWRAARALGYTKIITYILSEKRGQPESGGLALRGVSRGPALDWREEAPGRPLSRADEKTICEGGSRMNIPQETRRESHDKVLPSVEQRQTLILALLKERDPMTAQEVADELHLRGHTPSGERNYAAPRLTELRDAGSVEATGKKICGRTGRNVTVWAAKGEADG